MSDEIHIPESAQLDSEIHHRHMVQLFMGAGLVLVALLATALYITYTKSVWPFKPLSTDIPKGEEMVEVPVEIKSVEDRLTELNGSNVNTEPSSGTTTAARRAEMATAPTVQATAESNAKMDARLKELSR